MDAPWIAKKDLVTTNGKDRLNKEILAFVDYLKPTEKETSDREKLFLDIRGVVDSLYPAKFKTVPFGSVESGLLFPSSDVDINIEPIDPKEPCNSRKMLGAIRKRGIQERLFYFQDTTPVFGAKIPILIIKRSSGVSADISIANDISSSHRTKAWIRQYPELKPLFMVLKQSIGSCRASRLPSHEPLSAKTNGLASFGLICLIVNYLEHEKPEIIQSEQYYATLLMGFLDFYSKFDEINKAISMQNGGCYYDRGDANMPNDFKGQEGRLFILDPDKETNVARSCTHFTLLKEIMRHLHQLLENRLESVGKNDSILSSIIKLEHHRHEEPRREGIRFVPETIIIENGNPSKKAYEQVLKLSLKSRGVAPKEKGRQNRGNQNRYDRNKDYPYDESVDRSSSKLRYNPYARQSNSSDSNSYKNNSYSNDYTNNNYSNSYGNSYNNSYGNSYGNSYNKSYYRNDYNGRKYKRY